MSCNDCKICGVHVEPVFHSDHGQAVCEACHKAKMERQIAEFDGDTQFTDQIVCPYCGYKWDDFEATEGTDTCGECGNEFELAVDYSVTYCTSKKEES